MKQIEISAIKISDNRQRKNFPLPELIELRSSIETLGLLHPIILRVEGELFVLVAGERRLRAIVEIWDMGSGFKHDNEKVRKDCVPYVLLQDLDPLDAEEAEYDENTKRMDLSWQERAEATSRLESLRRRKAERDGKIPPTLQELTQEVKGTAGAGRDLQTVHRELVVAKNLHRPEVKEAKSLDEAYKNLKRAEVADKHKELAARVGATFSADQHRLFRADCTEWLRACPAETFDVILTDPPYGMGADTFGDSNGVSNARAHSYTDSYENFKSLMEIFCEQSFRVAKAESHLYLFCDIENFFDLRVWLSDSGWDVFRTPLIWHKPGGSRTPWVNGGPQRRYELCLFARKGKRLVTKLYGDVLEHGPDSNEGHSAQKPVALYHDLLQRSVRAGDSVLDCFAGSGPIFPAAHQLKCRATGVEIDPTSYGIAVKRIEAIKAQIEFGF